MNLPARRYKLRIKAVLADLRARKTPAVLVLSTAAPATKSRDGLFPYRPNSDFFYLTGSPAQSAHLVISSETGAVLVVPKPDPIKIVWDGAPENTARLAANLGVQHVVTKDLGTEIKRLVKNHRELFFQNTPGTYSWALTQELIKTPSHLSAQLPRIFGNSDQILDKMRLIKDSDEVRAIERAADVTFATLASIQPLLRAGSSEATIAAALEFGFKSQGATTAFNSIVGCGVSAATLHYDKLARRLKNKEMCLIDCGAELDGYAADVTRVFPIGGTFEPAQRKVYEIVLASQKAAIKAIKPGIPMGKVYAAAAQVLTEGLIELKVLRGSSKSLIKKEAYKPYFPHGIGHTLGLDVHDVGNLRGNNAALLAAGMVITVEPGLYFPKRAGLVPPCGVRIEDDVLVTKSGCEILTARIPKEVDELENGKAA